MVIVKLHFITRKLKKIHCTLLVRKLLKYQSQQKIFCFIERSIVNQNCMFFSQFRNTQERLICQLYLELTAEDVHVFLSSISRTVLMKYKPENINDFRPLPFIFCFLGPHLQHMEVPRLGVKSELQLPAYKPTSQPQQCQIQAVSATYTSSPLHCWILNPMSEARD